jgi:hypothetical protein
MNKASDLTKIDMEAQAEWMVCSILLLHADGKHVQHATAPSLPEVYENSLGAVGNSIAGILGGGLGGTLLHTVMGSAAAGGGGMDLTSILSNVAGGGVGGAILMAVVGLIKNAMAKK